LIIIINNLETAYNIRIPGFGTDEVRARRAGASGSSAIHQQRLNQVKKAMAVDSAREKAERSRVAAARQAVTGIAASSTLTK
jgi:transcription initiation factor TFIID subunit TAF12